MSDEARKSSPWPLAAIGVVVLLLSVFLYLKLSRKPSTPDAAENRPSGPSKRDADGKPIDVRRREHLERARTCLEEGRLEEAAAALEEARKLGPGDDLDELQTALEKSRQDRQAAEERRKLDQALGELKEKWDSLWKPKYLWDEAHAAVVEFVKKFPAGARDSNFEALRRQIEINRDEHDAAYRNNLELARKLHAEGKTAQALSRLQVAASFYPERASEVARIRGEWESALLDKEMVRINDVEVWIGSDEVEDEKPRRRYKGAPFKIDKYEVTNEEYAAFLSAHPSHPAPIYWKNRKYPPEMAKFPVVTIRLADAEAYAKWAKKRLPTAEEWEKAARFIDGRRYPWGEDFPQAGSGEFLANSWEYWQHNADRGRAPSPLAVGSFPNGRSGFDVYDMAGNVWEWTSTRVVVERDGQKVEMGVLKGGSYMTSRDALRCSNRLLDEVDFGHPDYGFRCVRD